MGHGEGATSAARWALVTAIVLAVGTVSVPVGSALTDDPASTDDGSDPSLPTAARELRSALDGDTDSVAGSAVDLDAALARLAEDHDRAPPGSATGLPEPMRGPVARLVDALVRADDEIAEGPIADDPALAEGLRTADPDTVPAAVAAQRDASRQGAKEVLAAVEGVRDDLRSACREAGDFAWTDPTGLVRVAGTGDDHHPGDHVLVVDCAGRDRYTGTAGANPIVGTAGLALDLAGDDLYHSVLEQDGYVDVAQGAGEAGVGILADEGGDDVYLVESGSNWTHAQGAGDLGGVGILHDAAGDDLYQVDAEGSYVHAVQGSGYLGGVGMLVDEGGSDARVARISPGADEPTAGAQGAGLYGIGVLVDGGDRPDAYTAEITARVGAAQGASYGLHEEVGALVDEGGDDAYRFTAVSVDTPCVVDLPEPPDDTDDVRSELRDSLEDPPDEEVSAAGLGLLCILEHLFDEGGITQGWFAAQGASEGGTGILVDRAGDDTYVAAIDGTGEEDASDLSAQAGASLGEAYLLDGDGDDRYHVQAARTDVVCQAGASLGAAILVEAAGDDEYTVDPGPNSTVRCGGDGLGGGVLVDPQRSLDDLGHLLDCLREIVDVVEELVEPWSGLVRDQVAWSPGPGGSPLPVADPAA